ncbi:hypothetical protein [Mycobacterium sp. E802]|uniref:hypothetical protein n=1 Tax=Mycobacterium sp. E802 TaxID=1834152 RepID=UPI000AC1DD6B|nr:hypothetical protein [Mycobacterium sp. E802]
MRHRKTTQLKMLFGGIAAAGALAFTGLSLPAQAFAAPGDPGGGGYINNHAGGAFSRGDAGGGYATGSAGGAFSREGAAGGGYARGIAGGGYLTGDAGGAWFREACANAKASNGQIPIPIGCAS